MSLFGNTYIDNLTIPESNSYEWLYAIGGVILGWGLPYLTEKNRRKKEIEKVGNLFEAGLKDIKVTLKAQYNLIESYKSLIEEKKVGMLGIAFIHENNPFLLIDRIELFNYYFNKRKDKDRESFFKPIGEVSEESIHLAINKAFNEIGLIYIEVKRLSDTTNEFIKEISSLGKLYVSVFGKLGRCLTNRMLKMGNKEYQKDLFAMHLHSIIKENGKGGLGIEKIVTLDETVHKHIFNIKVDFSEHPLFDSASEFDAAGINLINSINSIFDEKIDFLDVIKTSLAERYKALFHEEITK